MLYDERINTDSSVFLNCLNFHNFEVMKWGMADSADGKSASFPGNSISRRNSSRFMSAILRYSARKRKQDKKESSQTLRLVALSGTKRNAISISKEELTAIQIQLAILSDGDGDRPIHIAVANENLKLVQKLCLLMLKNKISLDITNYLRQTPLHLAVMLGNVEIVQMLLNFGASPLLCDRNGNSVVHLAVKSHQNKEVLQLILSHCQDQKILDLMDYEGYSALHYAVFKNHSKAVEMLSLFGADMNKIDGKSGRTALIHAVIEQNTGMIELLLNCKACPQKTDYSGRSAFEMALQIANVQIIKVLEKWMPLNEMAAANEKIKTKVQHSAKIKRTKK